MTLINNNNALYVCMSMHVYMFPSTDNLGVTDNDTNRVLHV